MPDIRETLRTLRSLQELDRDLYKVNEELRRLPEERARRRGKIDGQVAERAELERRVRETQARVKEIEDLTTSQRQRVRKLEGQAAESRSDAALLAAFQHEIRSLKRDISEAEEEGLGLVEEVERLTGERDALDQDLGAMEQEFSEYEANVARETSAAEARRAELDSKQRRELAQRVPPDVLAMYEKLIEAREGEAMAELENRVCQGCYVSVPNNIYVRLARCTELVPCPSCGRILYLEAMG